METSNNNAQENPATGTTLAPDNTEAHRTPVKKTVLDAEDVFNLVPRLRKHPKLVDSLLRFFYVDHVNDIHSRNFDHKGPAFSHALFSDLDIKVKVDGMENLDLIRNGGPFITVSNHPFGAVDGMALIELVGDVRPDYKVMVNMILGKITALAPNFITVDALASDDPAKKAVSMVGIRQCIEQVKKGHGLGFFPAGAVSKVNWRLRLNDRKWQPSVIRLIDKLKVPVIPIYFHGTNSWFFNFLGVVSWQLRTLRLPREVWGKSHKTIHISVGAPITVEEQRAHAESLDTLGAFLKARTFALRSQHD